MVSVGVVSDGDVPNTSAPLPVSSVTAAARFAEEGVARKVATPAARPDTPVAIGNPVQFVNVPDVGVPRIGVTSVGEVPKTSAPVPVSPVTAAARFALDGVARNVATPAPSPETPVATGSPVQFVSVPDAGVPRAGVTNVGDDSVGDVARTPLPVPVVVIASWAVPAELTATILPPLPVSGACLSKPPSTEPNSERTAEDDPKEPVAGVPVLE